MPDLKIINENVFTGLQRLAFGSVHCCVTSPPYWQLRSYLPDDHPLKDQEIGLEPTVEEYIAKLVRVFRLVRDVLHPSGVVFVNIGDSYAASGCGGDTGASTLEGSTTHQGESKRAKAAAAGQRIGHRSSFRRDRAPRMDVPHKRGPNPKNRMLVPFHLAIALQNDGWYVRDVIVWHKPNPMPESAEDRCTQSWEPILMLTKSERYFFDSFAIREKGIGAECETTSSTRNRRNVWSFTTEPYDGAHYATFPTELPRRCILAGTSARGVCPRCGEPWTRIIEKGAPDLEHQRACGGDMNGEYFGQAQKDYKSARAQDASAVKARILAGMVTKKTIGWEPGCKCDAEPVPATVLDVFAGTFTTCAVALELGRHAIGIELDESSVELGRQRCNITPGLQLA